MTQSHTNRPMTLVVGTGRCGSTMISNILRKHPEVLSLSEFFVLLEGARFREGIVNASQFWKLLSTPSPFITHMLRHNIKAQEFLYPVSATSRFNAETGIPPLLLVTLPHLTDDYEVLYDEVEQVVSTFPPDQIERHYTRLFAWLQQRFKRKVIVERSGFSLPMLGALIKLFPFAKFVHIARDGRECAMSMVHHQAFRLMGLMELQSKAQGMPSRLLSDRGDEDAADQMETMSRIDVNAIAHAPIPMAIFGDIWSKLIILGTRYLSTLPEERVTMFSYEEFVAHPADSMQRLINFIDPSLPCEEWIQSTAAFVRQKPTTWQDLPTNERVSLEAACQPGLEVLELATHEGLHSSKLAGLLERLSVEVLAS